MTDFQKAWAELVDAIVDALRVPHTLAAMAHLMDRHPWLARLPSPPRWMTPMFWIHACVAQHAIAIGIAWWIGGPK